MRCGSLVATAVAFALFTVSSALASTVTYVTTWQGVGVEPAGLEVDASGNVYVADLSGNQVLKYSSSGALLQTIAPTEGDGILVAPSDVAIGSDGSIYVSAAAGSEYVRKFASDGTYSNRWAQAAVSLGVATDAAGNVYASGVNGSLTQYDASGNPTNSWTGFGSSGLAFSPSQTIAYGATLSSLVATDLIAGTTTTLAALKASGDRSMVAVNSATGNIYVAERGASAVEEYRGDGTLIQTWNTWGSAGSQASYSASSASFGTIFGIAVDSTSNDIYVTDQSGKVVVFNESVPEPGTITLVLTGLIGLAAYAWRKRKQV